MENGEKIGEFVMRKMKEVYNENLLTADEIQKLQNKEYSKKEFKQNFEILRNRNRETYEKGGTRYYLKEFYCGGYYLTNNWYEWHREPFLTWLRKIKK